MKSFSNETLNFFPSENSVALLGETELSEGKKFSVSLEKDFIFRFHIYFSASFASYFLVSNT